MNRRTFLAAGSAALALPAVLAKAAEGAKPVRFGVITDVHQDIIPDAPRRLKAFLDAMNEAKVDFLCQLGDFCIPKAANREIIDLWNSYPGTKYHVLGNHDMDGGYKPDETAAFYGMPARYYTFLQGGLRFIVLDSNEPGGMQKGYKRFIGETQASWLKDQLAASKEPVIVLLHHPLETDSGVENHGAIQKILEASIGTPAPVLAVFAGHLHEDYVKRDNGIPYIQVNSASYFWMGEKYNHESYDAATHQQRPHLKSTCPYKDPLWAIVTVDIARGLLHIDGRATEWVGPSPWQLGATENSHPASLIRPAISAFDVKVGPPPA